MQIYLTSGGKLPGYSVFSELSKRSGIDNGQKSEVQSHAEIGHGEVANEKSRHIHLAARSNQHNNDHSISQQCAKNNPLAHFIITKLNRLEKSLPIQKSYVEKYPKTQFTVDENHPKKSHFTILRAKRATKFYFEFLRQRSLKLKMRLIW